MIGPDAASSSMGMPLGFARTGGEAEDWVHSMAFGA